MDDAERREIQDLAHDDLMRYREAKRNVEHFAELIEKLKSRIDGTVKPLSKDKVLANNDDNSADAIMAQIVDLQRSYGVRALRAEKICMELESRISDWTDGIEERILRAYYLYDQRLEQIAVAEDYSYTQAKRMRRKALENYGKKLKEYQNNT